MPTGNAKQRWDAGAAADLVESGRLVVEIDGVAIGIFRTNGRLYAYENRCPHMGGPVCQGLIVPGVVELLDERRAIAGSRFDDTDLHIVCPWHGMEFKIRDGCHAGKSDIKLRAVGVEERDGRIYLFS